MASRRRARAEYEIGARDRTRPALRSVEAGLNRVKALFRSLAAIAGIGILVNAAGRLSAAVRQTGTELDRVAKTARRFGVAPERFGELATMAEAAGITVEELAQGIRQAALFSSKQGVAFTDPLDNFMRKAIEANAHARDLQDRINLFQGIFGGEIGGRIAQMFEGNAENLVAAGERFRDRIRSAADFALAEQLADQELELRAAQNEFFIRGIPIVISSLQAGTAAIDRLVAFLERQEGRAADREARMGPPTRAEFEAQLADERASARRLQRELAEGGLGGVPSGTVEFAPPGQPLAPEMRVLADNIAALTAGLLTPRVEQVQTIETLDQAATRIETALERFADVFGAEVAPSLARPRLDVEPAAGEQQIPQQPPEVLVEPPAPPPPEVLVEPPAPPPPEVLVEPPAPPPPSPEISVQPPMAPPAEIIPLQPLADERAAELQLRAADTMSRAAEGMERAAQRINDTMSGEFRAETGWR